ncbi:hypothetical protein ABIA39_003290 [Nocardia sp. GAS34]
MRAYPANAKKSRPAACRIPGTAISPPNRSCAKSAWPLVNPATTTADSTASTTATITRVSHADFWIPP